MTFIESLLVVKPSNAYLLVVSISHFTILVCKYSYAPGKPNP